ncbi:MAG: hypothetical protein HY791_34635 [Deltaproteobacteria bacterium]|nr:hypothetical protein [Deltaproteobacteria bacterium]
MGGAGPAGALELERDGSVVELLELASRSGSLLRSPSFSRCLSSLVATSLATSHFELGRRRERAASPLEGHALTAALFELDVRYSNEPSRTSENRMDLFGKSHRVAELIAELKLPFGS